MSTSNAVTATPAADSTAALAHFQASLGFETDCSDVSVALASGTPGFVLLDVRSPALYAQGHVPGAINLPHGKIVASKLADYPPQTLFVTYCAGPHCNGATRGAIRLAQLGRPVKLMIGGVTGWLDEGLKLATGASTTTDVNADITAAASAETNAAANAPTSPADNR
ncbi:rhodanese-like domain-containing protein [Paraburkholderia sp. BCC1886]|uniref:rhodanese-like domain-containing protein n=1 Tax=Paraburkholderia sp. BCC1886 TaxID=2562670 RepID=UPI0011841724|nr:rhodanese-like domain-containing protein [Paraburkholderia sp. BCC1886]